MARDGWRCVECGHEDLFNAGVTLDVHHAWPVLSTADPFDPAGCLTKCDPCHAAGRIHAQPGTPSPIEHPYAGATLRRRESSGRLL